MLKPIQRIALRSAPALPAVSDSNWPGLRIRSQAKTLKFAGWDRPTEISSRRLPGEAGPGPLRSFRNARQRRLTAPSDPE